MDTKIIERSICQQMLASPSISELSSDSVTAFAVTGLNEEAGEVAGLLCRELYKCKAISEDRWLEELGDCLWYLVSAASCKGFTLEDLFNYNTKKLEARYGKQFG